MTREELRKEVYKIPFQSRQEAKKYMKENDIHNYKIKEEKNGTYHVTLLDGGRETGTATFKTNFSTYPYVKIARQLVYPESVVNRLRECKDDEECSRVLADARHGIFPKEKEEEK